MGDGGPWACGEEQSPWGGKRDGDPARVEGSGNWSSTTAGKTTIREVR